MRYRSCLFLAFMSLISMPISAQETGLASYYHEWFNGKRTASGELYDDNKLTCAHKSLPLGTVLRVTNLDNNKNIIVRVNDRGPYVKNRILDLSKSAATKLGYVQKGVAQVTYEIISSKQLPSTPPTSEIDSSAIAEQKSEDKLYEINVYDSTSFLKYTIRIGSYDDMKHVLKIASDIKSEFGEPVFFQAIKLLKGNMYRVFVGIFNSMDEGEMLREKIRKKFKESYVVKYEKFK